MEESRKDIKQALNVLAHGLLQAVENTLLLRRGLGVGGGPKRSKPRINSVNQEIQQRTSIPIDS